MIPPVNNLSQKARAYFMQQGQGISKLNDILNSSLLNHHARKWFSILVEIVLYLTFLFIVLVIILLPTDISAYLPINDYSGVQLAYQNDNFRTAIISFKVITVLVCLPMLAFARVLNRSRKKNELIREAFMQVLKMKQDFDIALKDLNL